MRGVLMTLLVACLGQAGCSSAVEENVSPRRIALTFDDAPRGDSVFFTGVARTEALVDALERAGVEGAMFFVTTGNLERENGDMPSLRADLGPGADRLRSYVAAGHRLANHTHSHLWLSRTDPVTYVMDIAQAGGRLRDFDGVEPFFRFPYLDEGDDEARRDAVRDALTELGLSNGYVTVDNYDWFMDRLARGAEESGHDIDMDVLRDTYVEVLIGAVDYYDTIAREVLNRSPAHVMLLHENDLAAMFVDDFVAALEAEGWEVIPALEAFEDPIADILPDTVFNGRGRVAAIAHAEGWAPRDLVGPASNEDYLRALFAERGLSPSAPE